MFCETFQTGWLTESFRIDWENNGKIKENLKLQYVFFIANDAMNAKEVYSLPHTIIIKGLICC